MCCSCSWHPKSESPFYFSVTFTASVFIAGTSKIPVESSVKHVRTTQKHSPLQWELCFGDRALFQFCGKLLIIFKVILAFFYLLKVFSSCHFMHFFLYFPASLLISGFLPLPRLGHQNSFCRLLPLWCTVIGWLSEQRSWGDVTIDTSKIRGKLIICIAVKISVNCISVLESSGLKWYSGKWEMISCDYFVRELRNVLDLWLQFFFANNLYLLLLQFFIILGNLNGIKFTYGFQKNSWVFSKMKKLNNIKCERSFCSITVNIEMLY